MVASSSERLATLSNVRPRNVYTLLEIVHGARHRDRAFIATRYADGAQYFEETLTFLVRIGWLRTEGKAVHPAGELGEWFLAHVAGATPNLAFAEALLEAPGPYQRPLARYLSRFRASDGGLVHRPTLEGRLRDADVRDFFMDLGAITYDADRDVFVLGREFAACALWARNVMGPSGDQLEARSKERLDLGHRAELEVVDWERRRVGLAHRHRVRHVAKEFPGACFDVQSVTVEHGADRQRFIEVKAVGSDTLEFHWSKAEIEAAKLLGDRYFLYLVPVAGPDTFDLSRLEVVQDAFSQVYHNPSQWSTTVADVICQRRHPSSAS